MTPAYALVKKGLDQIPTGDRTMGLAKLIADMEAGVEVLMNGHVEQDGKL